MKCKRCKREIENNSIYCNWCGHKQLTDSTDVRVPIPKKKGKLWTAQVTVDGKRRSVSGSTEDEYYAKARAYKANLLKIKKSVPNTTLGTVIDNYLTDHENLISPSTLNGYKSYRRTRFQAYMDCAVDSINWQRMVNAEAKDYAPKTVINAWNLISLSLHYSGIEIPDIKLPKKRKTSREWLDYEQIQEFLEALQGKPYELGALLALNGLRRSELLYLKAEDVDIEKGLIHVHGARVIGAGNKPVDKEYNKTSASTRTVHIVIPRITDLVKGKTGRLITTNPTTLYGSINAICRKKNLPNIGVHGLRHSYCSLARHLNWDELTVMREGGWDDPKVVHEIYTHLAEQDANADVDKMLKFYKNCETTKNTTTQNQELLEKKSPRKSAKSQ